MQNCGMAPFFVTWAESLSTLTDGIWVKNFLLGQNRTKFEWRLFCLGLHLILCRKTDWFWVEKFFFWSSLFLNFLPPPFENPTYASDNGINAVNSNLPFFKQVVPCCTSSAQCWQLQRGREGKGFVFTTTLIAWSGFNRYPGHVVASLDKTLYEDYFCLLASNKQQIQLTSSKKAKPSIFEAVFFLILTYGHES